MNTYTIFNILNQSVDCRSRGHGVFKNLLPLGKGQIATLPDILGKAENMLADTGDFSESNVDLCQKSEIKALIPEKHHCPLKSNSKWRVKRRISPVHWKCMRHWMKTKEGEQLYAKRKSTIETIFGIIKQVLGFRQFLLRGLMPFKANGRRSVLVKFKENACFKEINTGLERR